MRIRAWARRRPRRWLRRRRPLRLRLLPLDLSRRQREALFPPEVDGVGCGRPMDLVDPIQARVSNRTRLRKSPTTRPSGNNNCAAL